MGTCVNIMHVQIVGVSLRGMLLDHFVNVKISVNVLTV